MTPEERAKACFAWGITGAVASAILGALMVWTGLLFWPVIATMGLIFIAIAPEAVLANASPMMRHGRLAAWCATAVKFLAGVGGLTLAIYSYYADENVTPVFFMDMDIAGLILLLALLFPSPALFMVSHLQTVRARMYGSPALAGVARNIRSYVWALLLALFISFLFRGLIGGAAILLIPFFIPGAQMSLALWSGIGILEDRSSQNPIRLRMVRRTCEPDIRAWVLEQTAAQPKSMASLVAGFASSFGQPPVDMAPDRAMFRRAAAEELREGDLRLILDRMVSRGILVRDGADYRPRGK
jgi:hypothetical protein